MLKRMTLALSFVVILAVTSFGLPEKAEARWGRWNGPYAPNYYGSYYGNGPRAYYGYGVPYRSNYGGYYASPRPYGYSYYGDSGYRYYRPAPRVAVQVGPVPKHQHDNSHEFQRFMSPRSFPSRTWAGRAWTSRRFGWASAILRATSILAL